MSELGIIIDYTNKSIIWDGMTRPMKVLDEDLTKEKINMMQEASRQSPTLTAALDDFNDKLEVEYDKANLQELV